MNHLDDALGGADRGPVLSLLKRLRGGIYWLSVGIFTLTISSLFLALFVNVVLRYLFERGITWAYEIPAVIFPWSIAAAVVIATCLHRNIQVRLLALAMPAQPRRIVGLAMYAVTAIISIGVIWTSVPFVMASRFMRLAETGIPQIYGVASLIYAFTMVAIIAAIEFIFILYGNGYLDDSHAEDDLS